MVRNIGVSEARRRFSELLERVRVRRERFVIVQRGKPVAALVGLEDLERLEGGPQREEEGPLTAARALAECEDFDRIMQEVYRARERSQGRPIALE